MLIIPYFEHEENSLRTHPWNRTEDGEGAYYDFKQKPDLIPTVLEDFKPHSHWPAVQVFYEFLRWVNGPESLLETNDCALRAPVKNEGFFKGSLRIGGRVEIFCRDVELNTKSDFTHWLCKMLSLYLQVYRPDFQSGVFTIGTCQTIFIALPKRQSHGQRLRFSFQVFGDTEAEVFERLGVMFEGLLNAAKRTTLALEGGLPKFP